MSDALFEIVPEAHRETVRDAVRHAVPDGVFAVTAVVGGASGALTYRVTAGTCDYLVRVETARDYFRNPERTYASMSSAADAGVAPTVHLADIERGVAVMDFIRTVPLDSHPGGVEGLLAGLGNLLRRLQATPPFAPALNDFGELIARMLEVVVDAGVFRAGALDRHAAALARVRGTYPFAALGQVSAHNDVNPLNVLYDGDRLWLIDWELSFRNDPFADLAIVANNHADTDDRADVLLSAALQREPTDLDRARLVVMRQLSRLFYGCITASTLGGVRRDEGTHALTPDEFRTAVAAGTITTANPDTLFELSKMNLAAFADGCDMPVFDDALARCGDLA